MGDMTRHMTMRYLVEPLLVPDSFGVLDEYLS